MANTYTWDFPTLDVHNTAQNGHDDVISTIHWRVTAVSDSEPVSYTHLTLPTNREV